ncbi:DUF6344 domain-containing protein [Streptomyces sp. NPDC048577]|uniref:DUF6344 domain-containing protein n=1 Tax=Streptomyces sp. NPDC048577 TaxID=3157209 RepID=UPI003449B3EC
MATAKVKQFWSAFISVLFALLASVGLTGTATAAQAPSVQQPEEAAAGAAVRAEGTRVPTAAPVQRSHPWNPVRDRSLPPTIKQRIGAEAHGSSPSVRHPRADSSLDTELAELAEPALTAAA